MISRKILDPIRHTIQGLRQTAWGSPVRRVATAGVGIIGFVSSVYGLWPLLFPEQPDAKVVLLPTNSGRVLFNADAKTLPVPPIVQADTIAIDGVVLDLPRGTLLVANRVTLSNGGAVRGPEFAVVAPVIEGGLIDASGDAGKAGNLPSQAAPTSGQAGGKVFIAAAVIEGLRIRADGGAGGAGDKGANGAPKPHAPDGDNGNCGGFGAYRGAQRGSDGEVGNPGQAGQDGAPGGDGGTIILTLSSITPSPDASASRGSAGASGIGGRPGPGQKGGKGGAGCVGLGGSQTGQPDGHDGAEGPAGANGRPSLDGRVGVVTVRHVHFRDIAATWSRYRDQPLKALDTIRSLPVAD